MTSEQLQAFIGEVARPFAIIATSASVAAATVLVALHVTTAEGGALVLGTVYAGVGALYGVKSWEKAKVGGQAAEVEKARVVSTSASPP
jgi:hypothetical protein